MFDDLAYDRGSYKQSGDYLGDLEEQQEGY
jgi:hypothetical protein